MKKIFRNLKFGLMLCAGALVASCSDVDDAMNEIPYARVLTPLNFEATVDASVGTDIQFSWSAVSNADSYILELFEAVPTISDKGEEVFEFPENFGDLTTYDMIEVAKDNVPYTLKNLEVDKSFWARVRGVSEKLDGSHWACLTEPVTTSAVRKALNPAIEERTSSSVTLTWDNADDKEDLTSIRCELVVPVEGATAVTKTLSENEIQNCKATFENLDPCTNYKFTLLFGKSGSRGIITAYTRPEIEGATEIDSQEKLIVALQGAMGDLKLKVAYNDGALYDLSSIMTLNQTENIYDPFEFEYGLEIYGESTAEGAKPTIKLAIKPKNGKLHFEDVSIDGGNQCGVFVTTGGSLTDAEFVNCEITGFTKGIWSGATGCNVTGTLLYENVYAHDINPVGAGGGDFIDIRGGDYGAIIVKNSTFYAAARTFLRVSETATKEVGSISVSNCTFNQVTATNTSSNNSGIFHVRYNPTSKPDGFLQLGSFTLTKCVFLNICNDAEQYSADGKQYWCRLTRASAENYAPKCEGNIFYNVGHPYTEIVSDNCHSSFFYNLKSLNTSGEEMTEKLALNENGLILEDDPCVNSIAGKMYLKNSNVIAANRAGDPRWWNATMPEVVRATELETVTEDKTWNFTDKTVFDTEAIEANTIIDNIRIYAPAEVAMGEGVTFAAAATVNSNGIPTSNALAFKAEGPGSVEITTIDGGINSSVVVLAGGDRYVVLADGVTHKVVLGDLQGENEIYVLAGCPITVLNVTWTKNLDPEATTTPLAAPKVAFDVTSLDQGTEQAITASWAAVEHAATYDVTFNGKTENVTEPSYVIDAATVAGLMVNEYKISVVAKPTSTSTKYTPSEAGEASFKIKKVVVGGQVSLTWNFDDETFADAKAAIGTTDNSAADTYFNGLHIESLGGTLKAEDRGADGWFLRTGGGGKMSSRRVSFVVPKGGPGTLKVIGANPSSSATAETALTITANINNGEKTLTGDLVGTGIKEVTVFESEELKENDVVYIYTSGGIRYKQFEYTYIDPEAGPVQKELVWDCTDSSFTAIGDQMGTDGSITATIPNLVWDGLTILTGSKTKYGTATINGESLRYIQWGGTGKANSDRSCYFTAPASGTLTVVASNTGSSEDTSRLVGVTVNGETYTQIGGASSNTPTTCTFEIDIDAATPVYVYPSGNGLRFFSIKYTYFE
ncbi:MAG: hypothetical protein K2I32_05400 [Alistipes sp.]|nr:hypothetical protein [Alistipes sp.]